ncbi:hypothetical protein [Spirosoma koreense]
MNSNTEVISREEELIQTIIDCKQAIAKALISLNRMEMCDDCERWREEQRQARASLIIYQDSLWAAEDELKLL